MKHLLLTTIAAVVLVGCGESQQSAPAPETPPAEPVAEVPAQPSSPQVEAELTEPVAEAAQPEPTTNEAQALDFWFVVISGHTGDVKQAIAEGADVNAKTAIGFTPLDASGFKDRDLLRKHGGKTGEELKADGR